MALLNKVSDGKCVLVDVTGREALVRLQGSARADMHAVAVRLTMSKKGKCFFSLTISDSSFHWASLGSIPVGFCGISIATGTIGRRIAHVGASVQHDLDDCQLGLRTVKLERPTIDPSGADLMSAFIPSKSRPTVSLSKYL